MNKFFQEKKKNKKRKTEKKKIKQKFTCYDSRF